MAKVTRTLRCTHEGCREATIREYDTRAEYRRDDQQASRWKCLRHLDPDRVLSREAPSRTEVLEVVDKGYGTFWEPEGSGYTHGPGFAAYAKDFPAGTRLIVTATIALPKAGDGDDGKD